jgi:hypothetical protein
MTDQEYKAEIARLRAENESLKDAQTSTIKFESRLDAEGRTWVAVKGIPGTGWGFSAQPSGWTTFLSQFEKIKAGVEEAMAKEPLPAKGKGKRKAA